MPNKLQERELQALQGFNFKTLAKQEINARIRVRLLALMQVQSGKSISEVSRQCGVTWKTARSWINKFLRFGIEGLADKARSGRAPHLKNEYKEDFKKAVELLQVNKKGGRIIAKDIQKLLAKQFNAEYDLNSIYKLLKKIGMVWITARSIHPKSNKQAQEAFKKTLAKK